jgi:membrane protein implicated in regulation of membrane protease activity
MSLHLSPGEIWIIAGLLGCALEMAAPGVFLLPTGLAAVGAGVAALLAGLDWTGQVLVFLALTAALVGAALLRMRRRPAAGDLVNAPAAGLIGQTCRALGFEAGEGRVSLGDGTWPARVVDRSAPVAGAVLRVVGLDGTTLLVRGDAG